MLSGKRLHHQSNRQDNERALALLDRAIALDPNYAHAHSWKACVLGQRWGCRWCEDRDALVPLIVAELQTALALDDNDSDAHRVLAAVHLVYADFEKSQHHQQRALSLNPNDDLVVVQQGEILTWVGRPDEGIDWILKAMRLNPYHPERFWGYLGRAYFGARRYAEAWDALKRPASVDGSRLAPQLACHAGLGHADAARSGVHQLRGLQPPFVLADHVAALHYRDTSDREHYLESLALAGLWGRHPPAATIPGWLRLQPFPQFSRTPNRWPSTSTP